MSETYNILSLDLGSTLGWALVQDNTILQSGTVTLFRKDTHPGDRFVRFNNWLVQMVQDHEISEIIYEDVPRFESAKAARVYCGLLCVVQMLCLTHAKRMTNIKPGSVKKEFCGNGNADKAEMCKTAHRLGWKHGHPGLDIDHDEADALAVAWVILQRRGINPALAAL